MINCIKHPQVAASSLCVSCGQWYCRQCMQTSSSSTVCRQCTQKNTAATASSLPVSISKNKMLEQIGNGQVSIGMALPIAGGLGAGLAYWWLDSFWLAGLVFAAGLGMGIWLMQKKGAAPSAKSKQGISDAQIATSLKISKNRLTPQLLAAKTQTSLETAQKKLSALYLEGKLEIEEEEGMLFYSSKGRLE